MRIDGKALSQEILEKLDKKVELLKRKGTVPSMAIVLTGDDSQSASYVKQKELKAQQIGAVVKTFRFEKNLSNREIEKVINKLSSDPNVHGIILQRPAPSSIDVGRLTELVPPRKEIDGFGVKSEHPVPVAQAVWLMLQNVWEQNKNRKSFASWLLSKKIVVIGKGETAGHPIIDYFRKNKIDVTVVDSKTTNIESVLKGADIIISAVGKRVLSSKDIKKGAILIGVGLHSDSTGKLKGDYDDVEIESVASYFSPTPGGVGPVNVACLLENLIKAASFNP